MYSRAWSNPQLSMEPKEATRRRAAARADKDEETIRQDETPESHVEETGEVVRYILFSR